MSKKKPKRLKKERIEDFIALGDSILIEAHAREGKTDGGIHIPDTAKQNSWRGTVISVGPGKYNASGQRGPLGVEVGDVLVYRNFLGWGVATIDGLDYYGVGSDEHVAKIPASKVQYA